MQDLDVYVEAMMKALAAALCLLLGTSATVAFAGPGDEANAVIDQWSAAYSANRDALVGLYAPDAILLGTTSPVISEGTEGIRKYFQELPGSGRKNRIVERRTIVLSETSVVGTGFYNFTRAAENDTPLRIPTKSPRRTDMKSPVDSETMSPTFPI